MPVLRQSSSKVSNFLLKLHLSLKPSFSAVKNFQSFSPWSRNKYIYAVRKLKKQADNIMAENLMEASQESEYNLLQEMKKIKCGKVTGQSMPDEIDGETEPAEILDKFREVYEMLYNSAGTSEAMNVIKENLALVIGNNCLEECC